MNKIKSPILCLILLGSSTLALAAGPDDYERHLDASVLYAQDSLVNDAGFGQLPLSEQNERLVKEFLSRKEAAFRDPCWRTFQIDHAGALGQVGVTSSLSYLVSRYLMPVDPAANMGQGIAAASLVTGAVTSLFTSVGAAMKDAGKCLYEKRKHDPIETLEIEYVKKKRFLSTDLQNKVENNLVVACRMDFTREKCNGFVKSTLKLPTRVKRLSYDEEKAEMLLSGLDPKVKEQIIRYIHKQVLFQPADELGQRQARKNILYFHGEPGTGKTRAAKIVAELLGVPSQVLSLKSDGGTKPEDVLGIESYQDAKPGLLAEGLMKLAPGGNEPVKNPAFIWDDGDRAINGEKGPQGFRGSSTTMGDLARHLLDPETKSFPSPYFGVDLDISNAIMIVTGNDEILDQSIKNRMEIVEFPPLTHNQKVNYLLTEFIPLYLSYLTEETRRLVAITAEDEATIREFVQNDKDPGMRSIQTQIENMLVDKIVKAQ